MARAGEILTRDEIRALTRSSDLAGALAIATTWGVVAGCFAALILVPHPLTFGAAVIVLGGRQLALAVMMHEAAHGTLFATRALNVHLADWLCARPVWADVERYRKHHLAHHAYTGTERDPDLGLAPVEPIPRASMLRKIARDLTGVSGLRRAFGLLLMDLELLAYNVGGDAKRLPPKRAAHHLRAAARNLWRPIAAQLVMIAILALLGHTWVYSAWAVAYLTTYGLFLRVRSLAEHAGLAHDPDIFANTRTTRASWLARATVAPLHVNFHLEHHLLPAVPWFRLPALHRALAERRPIDVAPGYDALLRGLTKR